MYHHVAWRRELACSTGISHATGHSITKDLLHLAKLVAHQSGRVLVLGQVELVPRKAKQFHQHVCELRSRAGEGSVKMSKPVFLIGGIKDSYQAI